MLSKFKKPRPICLRLLVHWARRAASRALWTAGKSKAIKTPMIAMTTSSSIRVKAPRRCAETLERSKGDLPVRWVGAGERILAGGSGLTRASL